MSAIQSNPPPGYYIPSLDSRTIEAELVVFEPLRPAVGVDVTPAVYGFASRVRDGFLERDGFTAKVALGGVSRLSGVR